MSRPVSTLRRRVVPRSSTKYLIPQLLLLLVFVAGWCRVESNAGPRAEVCWRAARPLHAWQQIGRADVLSPEGINRWFGCPADTEVIGRHITRAVPKGGPILRSTVTVKPRTQGLGGPVFRVPIDSLGFVVGSIENATYLRGCYLGTEEETALDERADSIGESRPGALIVCISQPLTILSSHREGASNSTAWIDLHVPAVVEHEVLSFLSSDRRFAIPQN